MFAKAFFYIHPDLWWIMNQIIYLSSYVFLPQSQSPFMQEKRAFIRQQ